MATPKLSAPNPSTPEATRRMFYLSGCDINYKETDSDGNVAVTGFVATLQAGDHDFTPPTKAFELGLDLITKANAHSDTLAALKKLTGLIRDCHNVFQNHSASWLMQQPSFANAEEVIRKAEAQ